MLKECYRNMLPRPPPHPRYVTRVEETCLVAGAKSIIHSLGGTQTKRVHTFPEYLGPKTSIARRRGAHGPGVWVEACQARGKNERNCCVAG